MRNIILVPLDGSSLADAAIPHAVALARRTGGALCLMRVHTPFTPMVVPGASILLPEPGIDLEIEETERAWLNAKAKELGASSHLTVEAEFQSGLPGDEIVAAARRRGAAFIVCTTHGAGGWAPEWFGSVTDHVIRHSLTPVLAMSSAATRRTTEPASLLVLLDGSEHSGAILPHATALAKAFGARMELYRVVAPPWVGSAEIALPMEVDRFDIDTYAEGAKRELDAIAGGLRAGGLAVTTLVEVHGRPTRRILEHITSANPDLVALATHGRGVSRVLLGSVADKVLRAGARPMLCVRPHKTAAVESGLRIEAAAEAPALT